MATNVDHAYYGWAREESSDRDGSQEVSASQMLDHGSISFGRFAFESLSWERRSVFTHNKSQEELEKFKLPGLVAQKKAYFEEYYKRIRALKAMQENQQTELTLDYGGDGSISSQTGEEDESTAQNESLGGGASNIIDACSKETSIDINLEKQHDCEAVQISHLDMEPTSSNLDSSRKGSEDLQEKNTTYALQIQRSDTEFTAHESLTKSREDIEQHDLSSPDNKGLSRKYGNSGSNIEREKNSIYAVQMQCLDRESIEQHGSKGISGKYDNLETIADPEEAAGLLLYPSMSKVVDSEKIKPTVNKYKGDQLPFSKVKKGPAASVRNGLKSELKTHSDAKLLQGPKHPSRKTISKAMSSVGSSKATADRVSRTYKSTPVASHRSLTEVRSDVTIARPFSFSTERRATDPAGIRESTLRLSSKSSNRLSSSLNQAKDVINVQLQGISKEAIICGVKSRGLENKRIFRVSEEARKIALTLDSQCTSHKRRDANVPGPPKATSVKSPAQNQSNPNVRSEYRSTNAIRKDKLEEGKRDARLREVLGTGTKTVAPPRTRQVVPSKTDHLYLNGRKPRMGSLSHNGTKLRQEMPQWR